MALAPRVVGLLGLLALGPVLAYALGRPDTLAGVVTTINVLLIVASLAIATRPAEGNGHAH